MDDKKVVVVIGNCFNETRLKNILECITKQEIVQAEKLEDNIVELKEQIIEEMQCLEDFKNLESDIYSNKRGKKGKAVKCWNKNKFYQK